MQGKSICSVSQVARIIFRLHLESMSEKQGRDNGIQWKRNKTQIKIALYTEANANQVDDKCDTKTLA